MQYIRLINVLHSAKISNMIHIKFFFLFDINYIENQKNKYAIL